MNKFRRKQISEVLEALNTLRDTVEAIHNEENEAFENMPESLEGTDRYDMAEEAVSNLDDALSSLEDAIDSLESAKE